MQSNGRACRCEVRQSCATPVVHPPCIALPSHRREDGPDATMVDWPVIVCSRSHTVRPEGTPSRAWHSPREHRMARARTGTRVSEALSKFRGGTSRDDENPEKAGRRRRRCERELTNSKGARRPQMGGPRTRRHLEIDAHAWPIWPSNALTSGPSGSRALFVPMAPSITFIARQRTPMTRMPTTRSGMPGPRIRSSRSMGCR